MSDTIDQSKLTERASALVDAALKAGADVADAVVVSAVSLGVEVRLGEVEETERAESDDFALRVFVGKQVATVSANTIDNMTALAERAVATARVAPEEPYAQLAPVDRLATDWPDLDLSDPEQPTIEQLTKSALTAEQAALAMSGITNSGGATGSWRLGGLVLATSHGFLGTQLSTRHAISATAVAGEGTAMERDYDYSMTVHGGDLDNAEKIGHLAAERALRRLNPTKMATGTGTVIFDPRVSGTLIGHLAGAVNGASIARGTSFLKDHLGKQLFSPNITISDDPHRVRGLGSRPFDGEGVATSALDIVSGGTLNCWLLDTATAAELGLETNGRAGRGGASPSPSTSNLTLHNGEETPDNLISAVKSGIYVTDLIGHGVNGVTGDYSRGAAGFVITDGQLGPAVSEITIAGNLKDMYAALVPANDLEYRFSTNAPTVAVEGMTIAGK